MSSTSDVNSTHKRHVLIISTNDNGGVEFSLCVRWRCLCSSIAHKLWSCNWILNRIWLVLVGILRHGSCRHQAVLYIKILSLFSVMSYAKLMPYEIQLLSCGDYIFAFNFVCLCVCVWSLLSTPVRHPHVGSKTWLKLEIFTTNQQPADNATKEIAHVHFEYTICSRYNMPTCSNKPNLTGIDVRISLWIFCHGKLRRPAVGFTSPPKPLLEQKFNFLARSLSPLYGISTSTNRFSALCVTRQAFFGSESSDSMGMGRWSRCGTVLCEQAAYNHGQNIAISSNADAAIRRGSEPSRVMSAKPFRTGEPLAQHRKRPNSFVPSDVARVYDVLSVGIIWRRATCGTKGWWVFFFVRTHVINLFSGWEF